MSGSVLLCDFSLGAYIKLALTKPGERPVNVALYGCSAREEFEEAVMAYLAALDNPRLIGAAISTRGWEQGGVVHLPEKGITIVRDDVRKLLGVQRVNLVNNFVARALAVPQLRSGEVAKVCGGDAVEDQVIAVLGPHHGLGQAGLAPDGMGGWVAMPAEGGHSSLPCRNEREWQIFRVLHDKYGYVSYECALSMQGLVDVWQALVTLERVETLSNTPEEVIALATTGDELALEAIRLCVGWLGRMAADVGLILGARGGIYLTGDLMDLMGDLFDLQHFEANYLSKGRLSDFVASIPVYRTLARDLELIGLGTLFD